MKLNAVNKYPSYSANTESPRFTGNKENVRKESLVEKFENNIKNSADLNDTVKVPRTIFKGYLAFTAGTALATVAAIAKGKTPRISNFLNIISSALIIFGTYSFVRPYLLRDKN